MGDKGMRSFLIAAAATLMLGTAGSAEPGRQLLPTGQAITPTAAPGARFTPLVVGVGPYPSYVADGAAAIALSPDKSEMLVLTSGFNLFNGSDGKLMRQQSTQYIFRYSISGKAAARLQTLQVPNSFSGIAWRPNGRGFVVGGGVDDAVYLFARKGSTFQAAGKIPLGHKAGLGADVLPQAAGIAVSPDGRRALVANYYNDSISLIDLTQRRVISEQDLRPGKIDPTQSGVPGGEFPFAIAWTDAGRAWVSSPRDRQLVALSVTPTGTRVIGRLATIGEPTSLLVDRARKRLIATEDNSDRIAFVDLATRKLIAEPRLALPVSLAADPIGKGLNPNGLAMLPDGRLLVTLGGINAVAVVAGTEVRALNSHGLVSERRRNEFERRAHFRRQPQEPPGSKPQRVPAGAGSLS